MQRQQHQPASMHVAGNYGPPPGFNWDWGQADPQIQVRPRFIRMRKVARQQSNRHNVCRSLPAIACRPPCGSDSVRRALLMFRGGASAPRTATGSMHTSHAIQAVLSHHTWTPGTALLGSASSEVAVQKAACCRKAATLTAPMRASTWAGSCYCWLFNCGSHFCSEICRSTHGCTT